VAGKGLAVYRVCKRLILKGRFVWRFCVESKKVFLERVIRGIFGTTRQEEGKILPVIIMTEKLSLSSEK
jgi:hypothetical protein